MLRDEKDSDKVAFTNVGLITMDAPGVQENHTVLVEGDRIAAVARFNALLDAISTFNIRDS